ncbi:putative UDP-glucose 4-epimerase [Methanocella conradii HZ254]|uniref:UDP-glucose 4-epimerase n=1 Tax=Methanocella conradii (strain DSM 24694 / JCM 17849 / CGMCC 1.5162 / HZ254) TaxID=1041930 RepID=H8I6S0_METCZ|nr:NAD-dependent epimerase/dehydratase family protein [Methanocella conradii]AFC99390.1 putative UDP-glucose 4-epimerase [Methanocella conradii HZ254]
MPWKGARVLVTGASGFIGGYLMDALAQHGASVTALITGRKGLGRRDVGQAIGNVADPASLKGVCRDVDVVYHLAAISNVAKAVQNPALTLSTNTFGTMNMLEEARLSNVKKFVYVSSAHVYGAPQYLPVDEAHPVVPREPYAASKIASEKIVEAYGNAYGMDYAIIRPFNVYGPGQDESFLIPGVIKQALKGKEIRVGNVSPTRDFLYVEDCVEGFLVIGDAGSGVYNIGSGEEIRIQDLVEKIRDMIDPSIPILSDNERMRAGKVEIPRMLADVSKLKRLGWSPKIGLEEGLARTISKERYR